jgi:hypothetical protein
MRIGGAEPLEELAIRGVKRGGLGVCEVAIFSQNNGFIRVGRVECDLLRARVF